MYASLLNYFPFLAVMLEFIKRNKPILAVLTGAFFISFSGVWVKFSLVPPTVSAFYRVFFGFLFLLFASLWKRDFEKSPPQAFLVAVCGLLFALDLLCWHASIIFIGPGLATILGNFQVLILASIGILFFNEKLRLRFVLSIPVALAGLLMVIGMHWQDLGNDYKTGIFFGLATALCYSGFLLTLRKLQTEKNASIFSCLMLISLTTSFFLALKILASGQSFAIPDRGSLLSLISLGLFSQTIGWVLIANSLSKIKASLAGLILLLQPALAFVWDVMFFGRETDFRNWLGVCIVLIAIFMGMPQQAQSD
jgi:drug/metabolite transporter (DMT)-like permease